MMNKPKKWLEKLNSLCLHEKVVFFLLSLVLLILCFDCWLKNLPITGYGLVFITLVLVGCTTWGTCHGIKWLLHCNKPLKLHIIEKSQNENLLRLIDFISKKENDIFDRIFDSRRDTFNSLKYPTNLNEQIRLFLKDTERDFIKPWYSEISQNPSFLFDTHLLLEEILFKIIGKLKKARCKNLILNILMLYLSHLQEYKKCVKKIAKSGNKEFEGNCPDKGTDLKGGEVKLDDLYRYTHPGSQSDETANYYLTKVIKWILREHAPQEFVLSLQCKILTGILARKVLKTALVTIEDPVWIDIKLINLLDSSKYEELLGNKVYVVKDKIVEDSQDADSQKKKPLIITKRYMKSNLFHPSANLFKKGDFNELKNKIAKNDGQRKNKKSVEKGSLNLNLHFNNNYNGCLDGQGGHISSVLGGIITSTAGPLLPDNVSVCYEPLNKMWQSPVREEKKDLSEPIAVPIGKTVVEGVKIDRRHAMKNKRLSRSRSTDSVSPAIDVNESFKSRDISIGEELCENVRFTSKEDVAAAEVQEENPNPNPNQTGPVKKLTKTRSFDSGSICADSLSMESIPEGGLDRKCPVSGSGEGCRDGDVSPVYEEPEDFATTIAKLRSLLQQRESSSTLSDKSGHSVDMPSTSSLTDSSNKTQSTDLENSSFDSQVAPDIPTDGRPFINVCIPKTEVTTDSNGSTSVIYFIQYDGIYKLKEQNSSEESDLVLQTTVVRRKFQEFVNLQNRLEECGNLKPVLKGIKGPSKWVNLTLPGKTDEATIANRRQFLEGFLQQLCSKVEVCAMPEFHEFLAYGCSGNKTFVKKDMESPIRRIDKLLTTKVTDVFNTIKTALPSFDFDSSNSISSGEGTKGSQDQKLLPGFLSFGNKTEEFELNFDFSYKEPTGETMVDDIRRYLNAKTDSVESAMDVLDSNDWLAEKRECRSMSPEGKCLWHDYKDLQDAEDVDQLDSWLPVYSVILDILCELLDESDSWVIKEPVVRLIKVLTGHWEAKVEEKLSTLDWDQIFGNLIRLLRIVIFQTPSPSPESVDLDKENTKTVLTDLIVQMVPDRVSQFIKFDEVSSAITLFVDSFQHFRPNRDVLLRFLDILLVQFLSCHHLTSDSV